MKPRSIIAVALFTLSAIGCGGSNQMQLRVLGIPEQGMGTATQVAGTGEQTRTWSLAGPTTTLKLPAGEDTQGYLFEAESDGFEPYSRRFSVAELQALPERDGMRELSLELTDRYRLVDELVVVYDEDRETFVGKTRKVRAWRNDNRGDRGVVGLVFGNLKEGAGIRGMSIMPDGSRLVFSEAIPVADEQQALVPQSNNVVLLDRCSLRSVSVRLSPQTGLPAGGGIIELRGGAYRDLDPFCAPDGQRILFASNRRRSQAADLLGMSATGRSGGIQDVYRSPDEQLVLWPSAGRDGTIVFSRYDAVSGRSQVWSMGGNRFPSELFEGSQPRISPDGSKIAFIGTDRNLWMMNADGTEPTQLTTDADRILQNYYDAISDEERETFDPELFQPYSFPTWMGDNQRIIYTSMAGVDETNRPNEDVWMMDINATATPRQLTYNGSVDSYPVASADGKWVYFVSNRGNRWSIWTVAVDEAG